MQQSLLFSERLKKLMSNRGINAAKLGAAVGISHVAIGNYLTGRYPRAEHLLAIAKFFDVTMDFLMSGTVEDQVRPILNAPISLNEDPGSYNRRFQNNLDNFALAQKLRTTAADLLKTADTLDPNPNKTPQQ